MARFDKYDPYSGGFRAPLAAELKDASKINMMHAVGLDANGRVVIGKGNTGIVGIFVTDRIRNAGEIVDVMTHGEIVEAPDSLKAGTNIFGADDGVVSETDGGTSLGFVVEVGRVVVRAAKK